MEDRGSPRPFRSDELQPLAVAIPPSPTTTLGETVAPPPPSFRDCSDDDDDQSASSEESGELHHKKSRKRRRPKASSRGDRAPTTDFFTIPDPDLSCCGVLWRMLGLIGLIVIMAGVLMMIKEAKMGPTGRAESRAPLWLTTHDTRSAPLDVQSAMARPILAFLDEALGALLDPLHYPCLCMHHVNAGAVSNTLYQVCSTTHIKGPLVNPTLVGRGNETDHWTESSPACQTLERGQRRARYRTIWLQWHDVPTGQQMFGRFDGAVAACMQLAMDEMTLGNKVCSSSS